MEVTDLSEGVRDNRAAFEAEVRPLIEALSKKLEAVGIPYVMSFEYSPGEGSNSYWLPPNSAPALRLALGVLVAQPRTMSASSG